MPKSRKPKSPPAIHAPESSMMSLLSGLVEQGVGGFFTTQRILLDLITKQNASAMKVMREHWMGSRHAPANVVTDLAREGMANFIDAQKALLTMAQRQNELVMTGVKDRVKSPALVAMTELVRRSVETFVDMQQHFLTLAGKHTDGWLDAVKEGKVFSGANLKELSREAVENLIRAQKKFLDVVSEEVAFVTEDGHRAGKKTAMKKTELAALVQQSADSLIETQKTLLDLAGRQMHSNIKAARNAAGMIGPFTLGSVSQMSREVVKSYVEAQKALMQAMQPHQPHVPEHPAPKKATPRARRAAAAQA
jgi:hypothetical protein